MWKLLKLINDLRFLCALFGLCMLALFVADPKSFPSDFLRHFKGLGFISLGGLVIILAIAGAHSLLQRMKRAASLSSNPGRLLISDPEFRDWFREQIELLRGLGFFEEFDTKNTPDLERELLIICAGPAGAGLANLRQSPILIAALGDPTRVLYLDQEDETILEPGGYSEILRELASISRGAFNPEQLASAADPTSRKHTLSFHYEGNHFELSPKWDSDRLDLSLLDEINKIIAPSGFSYYLEADDGQGVFVVVLTGEERQRLKAAGWRL